jgi:ribosome silencing factor RsfS/YbeB/iojap
MSGSQIRRQAGCMAKVEKRRRAAHFPRQVTLDSVTEALAAAGVKPAHVEGYERSEWILLDYFDFIVHVFAQETRAFYGLERLWGNAERTEINEV